MLALFSMALFVNPVSQEAEAQGNQFINICFDSSSPTGNMLQQSTAATCPPGSSYEKITRPRTDLGVCIDGTKAPYRAEQPALKSNGTPSPADDTPPRLDRNGKCLPDRKIPYDPNEKDDELPPGSTAVVSPFVYWPKEQYKPGGGTTTNTNTNINNNGGTKPVPPIPQNQGNCEEFFHKAGPLCVPNSPFSDDSIAGGNQTATSLAVRLIRILLYFAAIVAVIMIIIGGYYVMTAQGNEAQATTGRKTLTNAIIGLVITILAYLIVQAVLNFITK